MHGQCMKGVGVDCVHFLAGVLNELFREDLCDPITLPPDAWMHHAESARTVMEHFAGSYPHSRVEDGIVEPGDALIIGTPRSPMHGFIVGAHKNELWHATGAQVQRTGLGALRVLGRGVHAILRPEKESW